MKMERRAFDLTGLEVRADENQKKIRGYAAVFEKLSLPLYGFREKIARGAFSESIIKDDVRALWNHDPNYVLGRTRSGTLELQEDEKGLMIEVTPPDTQWARDLMESIQRRDVDQMSFGFETQTDHWDHSDEKNVVRTLEKVKLFDVSPVTFPAYPQTTVGLRSAKEIYEEHSAAIQEDDGKTVKEYSEEKSSEEKDPQTANIQEAAGGTESITEDETGGDDTLKATNEQTLAEETKEKCNQEIARKRKILDLIEKEAI